MLTINSVLDINGTFPYLINADGQIIEPRDYMDFDNIYTPNDTYRLKQTAQGRNYHLLKAFDFANYFQSDYWHYSDPNDLIRSAQPVADPAKCSLQLNWLERQLNRSDDALFQPGEQHTNLMTVIDSFGRPESATYLGHGYWIGSYHECKRVSLDAGRFLQEECIRANDFNANACNQHLLGESANGSAQILKFRYCLGKANDIDWPREDNYVPRISYKVGLCLPETCETLSFADHSAQIERLMKFNFPAYHRGRIVLHDMYCLPDDRSPIRQLPTSARIFLALCSAWLALLVLATCVHSCYKRHQRDLSEIFQTKTRNYHQYQQHKVPLKQGAVPLSQTGVMTSIPLLTGQNGQVGDPNCQIGADTERPLLVNGESVNNNYVNNLKNVNSSDSRMLLQIKSSPVHLIADCNQEPTQNGGASSVSPTTPVLCDTSTSATISSMPNNVTGLSASNLSRDSKISSRSSSLSAWIAESALMVKVLQALSIKETLREFQRPPKVLDVPGAERKLRVNLNALDAIKCLCCVLVIFGHIIFIHMQHLSNIIHTIELSHEIYPRALIAFFNFVDTFFIISGMLTAYFIFKRFNARTFSNPVVWLLVSLLRLLRLSPVYILIFWFIKTTSVYLTHGPIWDYGTDKNSIKGLCINDHWWKSILYFGNLGTMQPVCILPAWSIIVDAQYSLVIPLIMYLIFKKRRAGYFFLVAATIISATKMTIQLANQTAVKTSDMAKIRLHVYPLISRFAAEFYNNAWNRIGPVAVGIFGGHMLYLYEIGKIRRWPGWMQGYAFKLVLLLHVIIFLLPTIGRFIDDPESTIETDTTIFILSNATIKPIWSVINTIFLLRLITDLRTHSVLARLMSHNIWHCLGKLCFTSYLIHYEIILTLLKSRQEGLIDPNWSNALREFSAVFLISTLISYIIYILYEAPMNKLIMLAFANRGLKGRPKGLDLEAPTTLGEQLQTRFAGEHKSDHEVEKATRPMSNSLTKSRNSQPDIDYCRVIGTSKCTMQSKSLVPEVTSAVDTKLLNRPVP